MPTFDFWTFVMLIGSFVAGQLAKISTSFLSKKAENRAALQDTDRLTRIVSVVNSEFSRLNSVEEQKRKLKYDACLEALSVLDAYFSHRIVVANKQPVSIIKVREAHTKLILSCKDSKVVDKFLEIYFLPRETIDYTDVLMKLLNEFRNLIREELGFGVALTLDTRRTWVATAHGDSSSSDTPDPV